MKKFICILLVVCTAVLAAAASACKKDSRAAVSRYDIVATYDEESRTLSGTVELDYYNNTDNELSDLKFNLYGNAFRENAKYKPVSETYENKAYYGGKSYGGMEIANVEGCAGWNVGGEDENVLTVNLTEAVYPDQRATVKISYTLTLAKVNHRTGVAEKSVNLGNFYPILCAYSKEGFIECPYYSCGDPFVSDCADYRVTLDYPAAYTAATSGKLVTETETDGRKKCEYSLKNARDFAIALSDKFQTVTETVDGVAVSYYYLSDNNPQVSLAAACDSLKYFSKTFGAYKYPNLSVVQTGFTYGGMEYPALTMIADGLDSDNHIYTIVHETAHQWWYAMVGSNQLTDGWQDEGLAEYSTVMFFESNTGYGFTRTGLITTATAAYRAFFSVYGQLNGDVDTTMNRNLSEYTGDFEYVNVTYNKGMIMFDMLRNTIGDEKFVSCLAAYFKQFNGKIASAEDLTGCFLKCGTDLEGFFSSFIDGKILI